jgi:hypothetical protein
MFSCFSLSPTTAVATCCFSRSHSEGSPARLSNSHVRAERLEKQLASGILPPAGRARRHLGIRCSQSARDCETIGIDSQKLVNPSRIGGLVRRARRVLYPVRIAPLLAKIDHDRLASMRAQYASSSADAPSMWRHYSKYLDIEKHIRQNVQRAQDLNLHRLPASGNSGYRLWRRFLSLCRKSARSPRAWPGC